MQYYENNCVNEKVMEELERASTPEELKAVLERNNLELEESTTPEQFFNAIHGGTAGELDLDALDNISGGTHLRPFSKVIGSVKLRNPELPGLQPVIPPVKTR